MPTKQELEEQLAQAEAKSAELEEQLAQARVKIAQLEEAPQAGSSEVAELRSEKDAVEREWITRLAAAEHEAELLHCREREELRRKMEHAHEREL